MKDKSLGVFVLNILNAKPEKPLKCLENIKAEKNIKKIISFVSVDVF
jgi:hypothetical protein